MNFAYSNTMGAFPQQAFYTSTMANNQWLLQQPKDSGYASDDHDLFEKAFEAQLPSIPQVSSIHMSQQTPMSAFSDSSSSEASSAGSHSSPFEYADSLCTQPNYNNQWNPYESLNMGVKKLSIDAGITSMTGYCDIDSMLTAAYHNTSASQPKRFSAFSQSSSPRGSTSNQQTPQQEEASSVEAPASPALGRPRGRVPHTAVEQRYRANLNDNFTRLRNAVPEIATLQPARSGQPPKPSKAEVLAAAAEYIRQLEEENEMLRESMMNAAAGELRRKRAKTG
ncbi:hypothetical protein D6C84_05421 [Aureobasidium pullulans]|uniref:BHLH domain-containing protein n=1 Tax=Aureobasidium pullulans TaxID=5580 RepID=A0A4S9XWX4_AURPU|nr:hypothetical protein D6C84_05421 [Aureobasidium pullulans]